ncbi:hypothetical protein AB0953_13570 [Streptomyces sp. NPDC046866]
MATGRRRRRTTEARDAALERLVVVEVIALPAGGGSRGDEARPARAA